MKKNIAAVFLCGISISTQANGNDTQRLQCLVNSEKLSVGESRWIADPILKAMGAGRDWAGFRVVCRQTVKVIPSTGQAGSIIKMGEPVLMMTELSEDYFHHVVNPEQNEK
ncbi:hypothetical protein [Salinimonas chungwhensis]|uniref:hypothetical protein n=1 Tax=Salinimonas chungwhensis TaxID=265425 RepID=UPI00036265F7|nr:hypothetical protein [Salinimonas chungwhensis]